MNANGQINLSPRGLSRTGGLLYLLVILLGVIQQIFIRGPLFVAGDPAATAAGLRAMEWLWRTGLALEFVMLFATVSLVWVLWCLLRPVSEALALLALLYGVGAMAVEAAFTLSALEAMFPLGTNAYLEAWSSTQLAAMSYLAVRGYLLGFGIALMLFSPYFLLNGFLIYRSGYVPRALGMLYALTGVSYLLLGATQVLAPASAGTVFAFIAAPAFIGEFALCLWLLFKGVR